MDKDKFLEFALSKFIRFGSKRFTLDDLAHEMSISKKTIYENFNSKEEVVQESLIAFLNKLRSEIHESVEKQKSNPILAVIDVYRIGLDSIKSFSPSFFFGLKKYYPSAYASISEFRTKDLNTLVKSLLQSAKEEGQVRNDVNIELVCELYLNRLELILFSTKNLFEKYSVQELVEHIIINNLRGIATPDYLEKSNYILVIN
ncbi:TetR/AcrR family transcriptional regulator [Zobellia nedashkovskayae]|uniref:TetR/AcrR family transcriptional regulator n=1 Tax=Zobellia nedashkovskayae TaxID=2779510 RepID=UPI00188A5DD9|nr:TetR/AcrR family transcriptional regulator [Zobellia nedashkovskayae]